MIVSCIETFLGIIYNKYFFILMIHCKQYRLDSRSFKLFFGTGMNILSQQVINVYSLLYSICMLSSYRVKRLMENYAM